MKNYGLSALLLLGVATGASAGNYAIGTDIVRLVDNHQAVGRTFNVFYQHGLTGSSAALGSVAFGGDGELMFEGAYKAYMGNPFTSPYLQAGAGFFDYGDSSNDNELGFHLAVGYELMPARNFVFSVTSKATYFPDSDYTQFSPQLNAMLTF